MACSKLFALPVAITAILITQMVLPCESVAQGEDGDTLYYSANALYNQDLFSLAVGEYKAFLEKHPTHAKVKQAHYGLALSYFSLGKYSEAEPELKTVIGYGNVADINQLNVMLGQCQLKLNKPAEAEKWFLAASTNKHAEVQIALAGLNEAQFRLKKWKDVVASSSRLIASVPDKVTLVRALYQQGYALHQLKKFADAVPVLEKLLVSAGDEGLKKQVSFMLAECCRETDAVDRAEKYYAAAIGLKGVEDEVLYRLGFVRFVKKDYAGAVSALEQSLKANPASSFAGSARVYIARSLIMEKSYDKAIAVLQGVDPVRPLDDSASLWLARAYTHQKNYKKSVEVLKSALSRFPASKIVKELKFDQANALIAAGDFKGAEVLLAPLAADAKWGQHSDALRLLAGCLHRSGKYKDSLAMTDKFLAAEKAGPSIADMLFLRAENLYLSDQIDKALPAYDKFITGHKEHANVSAASLRKAQVHYRKDRWAEALALAAPLAKSKPEGDAFSDLNYLIGDCLFRLDRHAEAVVALTLFLAEIPAADPRVDTALAEIGVAYLRQKENAKAKETFEKLVANHPKSEHLAVAYVELGRMLYEAGEMDAAKAALMSCLKAEGGVQQKARAEYYLGWVALKGGDDAEALKRFEGVVKTYPKHKLAADSALQLGLLQLAAKDYKKASATLAAFLAKNPKHKELVAATYSLGVAQARAGDAKAAAQFKIVAEKHPKSEYADRSLYELAWCAKDLKKKPDAIKHYELLLKNYPDSDLVARVNVELAELKFEAKDYDKVIEQLEKSLTQLTDKKLREQTLYRLGTAWFNKGGFKKSAEVFETMCTEYPKSTLVVSARYQAGESRLKLGESVAARDHFLAVSGMKSDEALLESVLMRLGETQSLTGQWPEAAATYTTFLTKYPKSKWLAHARYGYAHALEKNKDYASALVEYRKLLAKKGKTDLYVKSQFQVGECLFALKKYDDAIKELVRVGVNYGDKEWAAKSFLEIGRILEAKGDHKKAIEQFRKTVEKYPDHNVAVVAKQRLDALRRK